MADWGGASFTPRFKWGSIPYIRTKMMNEKWWGYLKKNGSIVVKRYYGNPEDHNIRRLPDAVKVVEPFKADGRPDAEKFVRGKVDGWRQ
jgi:hypothetical protein